VKWRAYRATYGGSFVIGEFEAPADSDLAIMLAGVLFKDFTFGENEMLAIGRVVPLAPTYWQAIMENDL
jgi:hypothetical protein